MQPIARTIGVGVALSTLPASAYGLPQDLPVRKLGLWKMRMTGTVWPNRIKAITKYCLDASADRSLHEPTVLRKELEVVYRDIGCQSPNIAVAGDVMTGEIKPGDGLDLGFKYNSDEWPNEARPINIHESLKAVGNLLKEGIEINKRLGPM